MIGTAHLKLGQLLHASNDTVREAAWEELIAQHTRLILAVARSFGGDSDEAMDRYALILEKLRESDFRRLRTFRPDAGARFSTWLTVAARRFCLDYHRARYGRVRVASSDESALLRKLRRKLTDDDGDGRALETVADQSIRSGEVEAVTRERDSIVRDELKKLTAQERLLLALRFDNDLSAARIAAIVGSSSQFSVYRQLNSILARLRVALESRGIESAEG